MIIFLVGAILFSLVLAFSAAPVVVAEDLTPDPLGVTKIDAPQAYKLPDALVTKATGISVSIDSVKSKGKEGPTPTDLPFGPNVRVWNDAATQQRPTIVANPLDGYLYVAFEHFNGADWDIYISRSLDDGATWSPPVAVANQAYNEVNPSMAVTSTGAFALFYQQDGFADRIFMIQSLDGSTWTGYFLAFTPASGLSDVQYPAVATQETVGSYPDGIMAVIQVWCTSATNCGGGAHTTFWLGSSAWSAAPPTMDLGGSYWLADPAPGGTRLPDPLHPSVSWSSSGVYQGMDEETVDGQEWRLLWIIVTEDGSSFANAWISGARSWNRGIFSESGASGMNNVMAGTFWDNASSRSRIVYFYTSDGGFSYNGALLDTATTDQRSLSVAGIGTDWHITYYSGNIMTHQISTDSGANFNGAEKVSDNAGTAVNDDRATSVFIYQGAPKVAWQDDRDGDVNIYTASYITYPYWINGTCGGVSTPIWVLIDGSIYVQTPVTGRWAMGTDHTVQVTPTTQSGGFCKQCTFSQWSDGTATQPKLVTANGPIALEAQFNDEYRVQVSANPGGLSLQVTFDGTTQPDQVVAFRSPGSYQAQAPTPQNTGPGVRYVFVNWSDGTTANPKTINVAGPGCTNLTARFTVEYQITVVTNVGNLLVGYDTAPLAMEPVMFWAAPGTTHQVITSSPQAGGPGTRYRFDRWAGGPFTWGWNITVPGGPTTYTANFVTQYLITIDANLKLPGPDVGTNIPSCPLPGAAPLLCWADAGSSADLILQSPQTTGGGRYVFVQWSDLSTANPRPIGPINAPATYLSIWNAEFYLTMTMDPTTCLGTVTPVSGWQPSGNLTVINWIPPTGLPPTERYRFARWEGTGNISYTGPLQSTTITMNGPITQTAFCNHEFQVTVGTSPSGLDFEVDGAVHTIQTSFWWLYQSTHYINTTNQGGTDTRYNFVQWSDGNTNPNHPPIVILTSGTYTANFQTQHYLTLNPINRGDIQCDQPSCWYNAGDTATVSVTTPWPTGAQYIRYIFNGWSGAATGTTNPVNIDMSGPKTLNAAWNTEYKVTVTTTYSSSTCAPDIDCWFASGSQATISLAEQTVAGGTGIRYVFNGWSVDATGMGHPLTLSIDGSKNITVLWKTQYELTITSNCGTNTDCGTPTGEGWYDDGATATLTITTPFTDPNNKIWDFDQWGGQASGTDTTTTVTMDNPKTATASWTERPPPPPQDQGPDVMLWLIIIVIIVVVVILLAILLMKRKKPVAEQSAEEEAPPPPPKK